jgi:hypothetical protein
MISTRFTSGRNSQTLADEAQRAGATVALSRGDDPADVERRVAEIATHQRNPETYARDTVSEMQGRRMEREMESEQPDARFRVL